MMSLVEQRRVRETKRYATASDRLIGLTMSCDPQEAVAVIESICREHGRNDVCTRLACHDLLGSIQQVYPHVVVSI